MKKTSLIALAILAATPAMAHVVAVPDTLKAGSYSAIAFRVGHGCATGDATVKLRITIPAGVASARPQPKPSWTYAIERADPKGPPTAITFTGRLPDEAFDDFAVLMKLPDVAGPLAFPTVQTCEKGESQWTEVPGQETPDAKPNRPAPTVILTPADAAPAAHHH